MEATYTMAGAVLGISKLFGQNRSLSSIKKIGFEKQKNFVVVVNKRRFSKQETFCLGIGFFGEQEKSGDYEYTSYLFDNNREHFATVCVTEQKTYTVQVSKVKLTWKLFWHIGFVWMSDELRILSKWKRVWKWYKLQRLLWNEQAILGGKCYTNYIR